MKPIFIFGSPRSGTSWLARIFDSHPDTLYRHEPDVALGASGIPFVFGPDEPDGYIEAMSLFAERMINDRSFRSNAQLPQFTKSYRGVLQHHARLSMIYVGRGLDKIIGRQFQIERRIKIPDMARNRDHIVPVIKSVDSMGRLPLLARTVHDCHIVLLIRHPCGVISSGLRGQSQGIMGVMKAFSDWAKLETAVVRGLGRERLEKLDTLEARAVGWMLFNEYAMKELSGDTRAQLIIYDELCNDPHRVTRGIFENCGLEYAPQTQAFIEKSIGSTDSSPGYFQLVRNPSIAANRWKEELDEDQKERVRQIVEDSMPGRFFYSV